MLFSKRRTPELLSAFAGNFAQFGARVIISPFVLTIAGTFAVTKTDIGLVLTILWATFAFLQFPSGILADRYGEKSIMLLALGSTTVGSVLVATAPVFRFFVVAAVTLGAGAGLYFSVGSSLISKRYEEEQGRALSIHSAGGPVAGLLLPVAATWVATQYTWRAGVAMGAAVSILAFVGISVAVRRTPAADPSLKLLGSLHPRTALSLLTRPSVLFTTVVATAGMYAFQSIISFFPTFLREYHGFGETTASLAFSVMFALMAIGLPVTGTLADRHGTQTGIAGPMTLTALSIGILLLSPARITTYAGIAGVGLGITWGGSIQSRFMGLFSSDERGTGFGLVRSVFVLLGAVGNVTTGYLAEVVGWLAAFAVVDLVLLFAVVLLVGNQGLRNPH